MSGTFVSPATPSNFTVQASRQAGGNMIATATWDMTYSGAFTGPVQVTATINFHANGHGTINASAVCSPCWVLDPTASPGYRVGPLTTYLQGTNTWVPSEFGPVVLGYHATIRGSGSGGLAGLHYEGTVDQPGPTVDATATVRYHFDP